MAYDQIASTELDADSPITDTVTAKIVGNFDYLKAKSDAIPLRGFTGGALALGSDTDHDISVAELAMQDDTGAQALVTDITHIKQFDVRYATGVGGGVSGGLANAALISASILVSFDNATSKINGTGLFGAAVAGATVIVSGSASNDGIFEVTASDANSLTTSIAPATEAAGASITIYIIHPLWVYTLYAGYSSGNETEFGYDDSDTAANFMTEISGTYYRAVARVVTDESANIKWIFPTLGVDVQVFTQTGTLHRRDWASMFEAELWGGGGSGGSQLNATGTGAGGGQYIRALLPIKFLGGTETITIGAGGAPILGSSSNGNNGSVTTLGSLLSADFGSGGKTSAGSSANGGVGGSGAAAASGAIAQETGGRGGDVNTGSETDGDNTGYSGSGGGSAYTGFSVGGQAKIWEGHGGDGADGASAAGDGKFPSGGGGGQGGTSGNRDSGAGAQGFAIIWQW